MIKFLRAECFFSVVLVISCAGIANAAELTTNDEFIDLLERSAPLNDVKVFLASHHVDLNGPDRWGHLPIETAFLVYQGDEKHPADYSVLKYLATHGADVNRIDITGDSVLLEAAIKCNAEATKVLLELGANPDIGSLVTPLDMAEEKDRGERCAETAALMKAKSHESKKSIEARRSRSHFQKALIHSIQQTSVNIQAYAMYLLWKSQEIAARASAYAEGAKKAITRRDSGAGKGAAKDESKVSEAK